MWPRSRLVCDDTPRGQRSADLVGLGRGDEETGIATKDREQRTERTGRTGRTERTERMGESLRCCGHGCGW
jgi:hypothetical protein